MENFLYFIRDNLVGIHYVIYAFILFFLMFSIIGALFKQKYAVYDIKLDTSQGKNEEPKEEKTKSKKEKTNKKEKKVEKETKKVAKKEEVKPVEEKKKEEKVLTPIKEPVVNQSVVNNIKTKEITTAPIKEIASNAPKTIVKVNTPNVQINPTIAPATIPVPTPLPATPEVKQPVNIPSTGQTPIAKPMENKVTTEIKKTPVAVSTDTSKPIPELK